MGSRPALRAVMQIGFRHGGVGGAAQSFEPGQKRRDPDATGYPDLGGFAVAAIEVKTAVRAFIFTVCPR